ncbi:MULTISPECIES: alanine and proline-rich secreted protein Apa [unclassified Arthrobacter]|uniref:alanine and proline-rich secreted protein Apa n=1 Tax=unclassified Arthrobacter TaxID=235627 RepID=UPI002157B240|nr:MULTISPECIES: alanine and proline-rich secreted protein Apa [unclassified Arthrobacter]
MKYRRSGHAKYATLATLTLALTLAACAPSTPVASNSFTTAAEETSNLVQLPAAPLEEALAAPASEHSPSAQLSQTEVALPLSEVPVAITPVQEVNVEAPAAPTTPAVSAEPVVPAPPAVPAPPVTPAPQATVPPSTVPPAVPEITPVTPAVPSTPHVSPDYPQIGLYTFPDGHISFLLPAGWTAQTEQLPFDLNGKHYETAIAHIHDETGAEVAQITSGIYGGVVGGPVNRTILDSQPLTGFNSRHGASHFAFFKDEYPFDTEYTRYFMGVVTDDLMTEGPDSTSASSFLIMGNGAAQATANIEVSMTPESAAAWMETEQYSKLKALLTSLEYAE